MKLTILYQDKRKEEIVGVQRVASLGEFFYYETVNDLPNKGKLIPVSEVKRWQVDAVIAGGSDGLKL